MEHIRTHRDGAVGVITLDRRERFNSLDAATARDLRAAGLAMARDEGVRAVILRGAGRVFCSGADLKAIRADERPDELSYLMPASRPVPTGYGERFKQILEYLHSTISEIRRAPKPFVAAVDGVAAAGGLGLAMCCDLVIASERSTFEYAYFKTALSGAESTTFFLPKLVGLRRAFDMAVLNPRLSAREAHAMGLVSQVVPDEDFEQAIVAIGRRLADLPTASVAAAKRLMNAAMSVDRLDVHLDQELEALVRVADGPDFAEGLAAFFDKRPPRFAGRG